MAKTESRSPHEDLVAALSALENPAFDAVNDAFKKNGKGSGYVSLGGLLNAVRPVLAKHGIALMQLVGGEVGIITVTTRLIHESGQHWDSTIAYPQPQNPQQLVALMTYLRRSSLAAMVGVAGEADDDGNAAAAPATRPELSPQELETRVEAVRQRQGIERALAGKTPRPKAAGDQLTGTVSKIYENPLPKGGYVLKIVLEDTDMKLTAWEEVQGRELIAVGKSYTFVGTQKVGKYGPEFTVKDFHEAAATEAAGEEIPF